MNKSSSLVTHITLLIVIVLCCSCALIGGIFGASASAPASPTAAARAAVLVAKSAWVDAADLCLAMADAGGYAPSTMACGKDLDAAHQLIIDASGAVDSGWNSSAVCDLVQGAKLVELVAIDLGVTDTRVRSVLADAVVLAIALPGGECDAGAAIKDGGGQ